VGNQVGANSLGLAILLRRWKARWERLGVSPNVLPERNTK
jgi:hypothetical protein